MATNRIVHFEIPANQPEALTSFYGEMFGWTFQKMPIPGMEYFLCDADTDGLSGAVMQRQNAGQAWMNYVGVDSIDDSIARATALGAQVALPRMPIPGGGAVAAIIDPQGNICGLLERVPK